MDGVPEVGILEEKLSDLTVEEHIDTGGQKAVFRASDGCKEIALKVLPLGARQAKKRAEREVQAMDLIESPQFVELYDYEFLTIEGTSCLALREEFVPGYTLRSVIDSGDACLSLGVDVAISSLDLLEELDQHDIVHRDIKPSNIIIEPDGTPRLLDIGIVRFTEKPSLTPNFWSSGPGTPNYAAPEQGQNRKALQDVRTDMFSTGIVLYEGSFGEHPFGGFDMPIPSAIQAGERRSIPDTPLPETAEKKLDRIYAKMTAQEPYQRYRKPRDALEDLSQVKKGMTNV